MNPAEGAPAIALLAFTVVALYFLCVALAHAIVGIMQWVANAVRGWTGIGGTIANGLDSVARNISHAAGVVTGGIDAMVGAAWHAMARYVDKWLSQFVAHSSIILHLAELIGSGIYSVSGLRSFVKSIAYVAHTALHLADKLAKEYKGIEHRVRTIEREIGAGIGNDVRTSVDELVKWEKAAKAQLKADEKAITETLPAELTQLENFIKALPGTRYLDWAAGIVTAALGLGFVNFFRCPTFLSKILGRGCGFWNDLEGLLGLLADAIIFADLCQVPTWINEIFGPIEGFVVGLVSDAANAACAQPPASFATFSVEPAQLPPANSIGTLPS